MREPRDRTVEVKAADGRLEIWENDSGKWMYTVQRGQLQRITGKILLLYQGLPKRIICAYSGAKSVENSNSIDGI